MGFTVLNKKYSLLKYLNKVLTVPTWNLKQKKFK